MGKATESLFKVANLIAEYLIDNKELKTQRLLVEKEEDIILIEKVLKEINIENQEEVNNYRIDMIGIGAINTELTEKYLQDPTFKKIFDKVYNP